MGNCSRRRDRSGGPWNQPCDGHSLRPGRERRPAPHHRCVSPFRDEPQRPAGRLHEQYGRQRPGRDHRSVRSLLGDPHDLLRASHGGGSRLMGDTRLGVDVGGTFTDLVALSDRGVTTSKVPSTPRDQSVGVMNAIEASEIDAGAVVALAHGMTVATNALLERRGARTALVTTEGFRDILEIARQNRPSLYNLAQDRPPALVPRELRFTVRERMGPEGEIEPLDEGSLEKAVTALKEAEVEAVAVCLLFAFMHSEHERRVGEVLREELPDVHVSLSSEVLPEFREYERFSTTAADAYLAPRLAAYLTNLGGKVDEAGAPSPLIMQSSGGVTGVEDAVPDAARCVLSGPAGGVVGAAHVGSLGGFNDLLTLDLGGPSTDVPPLLARGAQ